MLNQDVTHPRVNGQMLQQLFERFQTARRSSYAHNGEQLVLGRRELSPFAIRHRLCSRRRGYLLHVWPSKGRDALRWKLVPPASVIFPPQTRKVNDTYRVST